MENETTISQLNKWVSDFISLNDKYTINLIRGYVIIDFKDILDFDYEFAEYIIHNPEDSLFVFRKLIKEKSDINVEISIKNLLKESRIRDLRNADYSKLISIKGIIKNISEVYAEIKSIKYECKKCGREINISQEKNKKQKFPVWCPCKSRNFEILAKTRQDCQKVVIEEELDSIEGTQIPSKIDCYLEPFLTSEDVERFNILGGRIEATGILKEKIDEKESTAVGKLLQVISLTHLDEKYKEIALSETEIQKIKELSQETNILDKMANSFAMHIYGLNEIKKAMILQMYGSVEVRKSETNKKYERGNFHILIVGDPSTGKTKLAQSIQDIAIKSKYGTGITSTKAGLVVVVLKDESTGGFNLQAGAVLLANNGIAILDEFDKMEDSDRLALHECMSEQTITIDKASIHTKLNCRTSILACANWKNSRFNENDNVYSQIKLPDSLISRFDLIFVLKDKPDKERDRHMVKLVLGDGNLDTPEIDYILWKKHIVYCKSFIPKLTDEIKTKIENFFLEMRDKSKTSSEKMVNITLRQAEAIKRLCLASARIHLRDTTEYDFKLAKELTLYTLKEIAFDNTTGQIDVDIIETGSSASEKEIWREILGFIENQSKIYGDVGFEVIQQQFKDMDETKLESIIHKLLKSGDIYEPRTGRYKSIN